MPLMQIDPAVAMIAIGITVRARTLGLPIPELNTLELDTQGFQDVLMALEKRGLKTQPPREQLFEYRPEVILEALIKLEMEFEGLPLPELDFSTITKVFALSQIGKLLGVTEDIRHFAEHTTALPEISQRRAHFLAMTIADLTGSYSFSGITKWFNRKRTKLGGLAPLDVLSGDWEPSDAKALSVRQLAASLISLGAT